MAPSALYTALDQLVTFMAKENKHVAHAHVAFEGTELTATLTLEIGIPVKVDPRAAQANNN
jgi:hypothetical protein